LSTFVAFLQEQLIILTSVYNGNLASGSGATSLATATVNGTIFPAGYTPETASVYSDEKYHSDFLFIKMEFDS
jgi:hypothetical protein